jgi:MFS family permease
VSARPATVATALCAAEVLNLLGFATFQALVPFFTQEWSLTNAQAGWISGANLVGYVVAVPVLVALTDRIDARAVFAASSALGGLAALGFAFAADGFVSALAWRGVAGIALAGIYMPGLKALSDRTAGPRQSRYVAFYTASFGLGVAASYALAGWIAGALSWRWAFGMSALGAAAAVALALALVAPIQLEASATRTPLLDFRPVLRNRRVLGFILGYFGHTWDFFAFRAWVVAFLAQAGYTSATLVAAAATLLGVPA